MDARSQSATPTSMKAVRAFSASPNTLLEMDRESERNDVVARIRGIARCLSDSKALSVIVYAMGAQRRSSIAELSDIPGVDVMWFRSLIPAYLAPIRLAIASYECAVRVNDVSHLEDAFLRVMKYSMAALYVVAKDCEGDVIGKMRESRKRKKYDFGVKWDPGYLIYMVDADSFEASTGIYEIVSIGVSALPCLRKCFDGF